jgi:hypothetical protein
MGAVGAEFVGGLAVTSQLRAQQGAVQVAASTVDQIRSLDPSDLVTGRGSTSVDAQFTSAVPAVRTWLTGMDRASDPTVAGNQGIAAAVPTCGTAMVPRTCQLTPGPVTYTVNQYLGWCSVETTAETTSGECVKTSTLSADASTKYLRAVVAVTWGGPRCGTACAYTTSTLVSLSADPTFRINAQPYAAPVVEARARQVVVVGDAPVVAMTLQDDTGVPTFTWAVSAGALPPGLSISATTGVISGTVQGSGTVDVPYSATIQVTDSFTRTDVEVVDWTVKPALALTDPGPQTTRLNQATSLTLGATGGEGAPYAYSVANGSLPPGLVLASTGVVSGAPSTLGNYTVTVRVTDRSTTRSALRTFTWTVEVPPVVPNNPGPQTDTVSTAIRPLQLSAGGGSGTYVWSDPSGTLPAGLSITPAGRITGTATALTSGSGKSVTLTITDPAAGAGYTATVTFLWSIVAKPTVTAPSTTTVTIGQSVSIALTRTCPNAPCSYVLNSGPTGLSVTSAGVITGTVGGSPASYTVTVTVTDNDGATVTSPTFIVIARDKPTVTSPGARSSILGASVSIGLTTSCPNSPCSYVLANGPTGLSVTNAGVITGTVGGTVRTYTGVTVTVSDAGGVSATSAASTWTVSSNLTMSSPGNQTTRRGAAVNLDLTTLDSGGISPYTFSASGLPSWLTLNTTTGRITGTAPFVNSSTSPITVSVTDASGVTATSPSFRWNVTNLANTFGDQTSLRSTFVTRDLDNSSSGGTPAVTYTQNGLPSWLSLNSTTGVISGTSPYVSTNSSTKSSAINVTATDSQGASITLSPFFWYVTDMDWVAPANVYSRRYDDVYANAADFVTGGSTGKTYSATNLPIGLSLASNGIISGGTDTRGTWVVTVRVTDGVGATVTDNLTWTVS